MSWLFNNQNVLLPSVYVRQELTPDQRIGLVQGRVKEAVRISNNLKHSPKVLSYWWYVYQDETNTYLTEVGVISKCRILCYPKPNENKYSVLLNYSRFYTF